ncbi:putative membrane protein [Pseudomonas cichorii]|uniref:Putative membrane protein n=1 Tax=Pseudomonas cichorii TaxID=36746 RepID=A0A3M4LI31_PSECI|nr:EamA family transporter [Pseudomonas cichorii]RMQ40661.1 putative membrane protein [Pseudomonas cichorii]
MDGGVFGGLMVMLCWGVSDFIQSLMIRQLGTAKTMLVRNIFTFAVASFLGAYLIFTQQLRFDSSAVFIITCSSAAYVLGYYCYMRGCEIGNLTLVSPIASTYSLVTILFSIIFLQEHLVPAAWFAVSIIFVGIVMTSGNIFRSLRGGSQGFLQAVLAMVGFGVAFFILGFSSKTLDVTNAFFYSALTQAVLFSSLALARNGKLQKGDLTQHRFLIFLAHSLLVNAGWVFYIFASKVGDLSLVTPISSVYSGVTVLLAIAIYREITTVGQKVGIGAVLVGVFLLSYK